MDNNSAGSENPGQPRSRFKRILFTHKLLVATAGGVVLGIALGVIFRHVQLHGDSRLWVKIWGELFLRMLKLVVIPLIVSCLVTGISSLHGHAGGYAGMFTLLYVFGTQIISSVMALMFCLIIKPGNKWQSGETANMTNSVNNITDLEPVHNTYTSDIIADLLRNVFPDNIIRVFIQFTASERQESAVGEDGHSSYSQVKLVYNDGTNMLGVIMVSVAIGFAISATGKEGQPLLNVFKSLAKVMVVIMDVIIWYSPFAIVSLVASAIISVQDLSLALSSIALYVTTFLVCAVLHEFALLPLIYFIVVRKNPFVYFFNILDGILVACGSTSGVVALPIFINSCKKKLKLDERIVDFVLPFQVSINRNGSAMFVIVSLCYIANTNSVTLGIGNLITMCLLTCLMASTVPPIASGSIIILISVASSLQLQTENRLAIILALEWLLDRVRTTNNLAGTGYGCAVIEKLCVKYSKMKSKPEIKKEPEQTALIHLSEIEQSV